MNWKEFLKAMLTINLLWFVYGFFMLIFQDKLPLNPDGNPGQTPDLAFNSIISFVTNTNLQDYSGESGATYLTQLFVFTFLQFVSAATGIACLIALFNGLKEKSTNNLGNFWSIFVKSTTRLLLPLSIILALILAFNGTPASFDGKDTVITMQGDTSTVSRGPAAAMIAIKQMGTNGGGYFGANSAHPLENPTDRGCQAARPDHHALGPSTRECARALEREGRGDPIPAGAEPDGLVRLDRPRRVR